MERTLLETALMTFIRNRAEYDEDGCIVTIPLGTGGVTLADTIDALSSLGFNVEEDADINGGHSLVVMSGGF